MYTFAKSFLFCALLFLCGINLYAQQKPVQPVKLFFEKVYLHTDRDEYTQGDTIWYKAYLINGQTNTPIATSGNLYTELIAKDSSSIISRQLVRLVAGTGNADFALSDSIPPGNYLLRAYTNWMRNFGDNFVFEKNITIINTLAANPAKVAAMPAKAANNKGTPVNIKSLQKNSGPIIRFYPESGSLIEGVNTLVAVKAEDRFGKGIAAKGAVLSASGDTAAVFNCDTLGMGLFVLLPVKGQVYHASINTTPVNIPQALVKGFSLRVNQRDTLVNVIISCNDETLADYTGKSFTLSGRHGGKTYFRQPVTFTGNQTLIKIPDSFFPEGVAALTLSEDQKDQTKPHCERLIYVHHANNVNSLTIKTDKALYQPREKVTLHIKTNGEANLSLAALDAGIVPAQVGNIEAYLMLQSEIRGNIESPARYFDTTNVNRSKQLDLLLMTQGWRDFVWRRLQDTAIRLSYNLENGIAVSGKVLSGNSSKPLSHVNVTMFASKNRGIKLFSSVTDSLGRFLFNGLEQYGDYNVKLSASDSKGEKKGAFVIDTLSVLPVKTFAQADVTDTGTITLISAAVKRREAVLTEKIKGIKNLKEVKITASKTVVFGDGIPMSTWGKDQIFDITPKDYEYKTLEWWMLHNVKGALQSNSDTITGVVFSGQDTLKYFIPGLKSPYYRSTTRSLAPEFFVNGKEYYPQENAEAEHYRNTFFPLGIDKFKRIVLKHVVGNLVNARYTQAAMILVDRYLLYITLKDDALVGYNPGVLNPEVNGYYSAQTFYKPLYDKPLGETKADLRTTIHWEPNITTDANGEATVTFYNADPKNKIRVVVEGLTSKGVPVAANSGYEVK